MLDTFSFVVSSNLLQQKSPTEEIIGIYFLRTIVPRKYMPIHTWAWNFFHGGESVLHKPKFRKGGGQIFRRNFRILLHFYYQFFSENLERPGVVHPGGPTFKKGGKAVYSWG